MVDGDNPVGGHGASTRLEPVIAAISRVGGAVSSLLILVILAITAISVFFRYVLGSPILGGDEATGFLVVAIVMAGTAEALRRGDHIRIDLILDRCGPRARWFLDLIAYAAVLVFAVLLLVTSWHTVMFSRQFGAYSAGYLALPIWIPQSAMVVGAVLLTLVAAMKLLAHVAGANR